jgi:ATP-dependent DNA helicase RecG
LPDVDRVELPDGLTVLALRVPALAGPYTYDGRPYLRNGPTTIVMPQVLYERKLLERMHPWQRWENQPAWGVTLADLDHTEVVRTIEEGIRRRRMEEPGTRDLQQLLVGLGLFEEGQLLNAAAVLFAKPNKFSIHYPQCLLKMARFRGRDKSEFLDNRQEPANAFDMLLHGQRFLRDHLPVASRILPNVFERIDDPLYPPEALREALANAICHRDYGAGGGSISIAIYDDRLEISSIGPLPFGQTPEDLARPHPSQPWNPIIAGVFYRRGVIEHWGRGTLKMAELTRQAGLPAPEIEASAREVIVRFRPSDYVPPSRVGHDLSLLQQQLLQLLARIGPSSLSSILSQFPSGTSRRTIQDNLQFLRNLGQVEVRGTGRWTRWGLRGASDQGA